MKKYLYLSILMLMIFVISSCTTNELATETEDTGAYPVDGNPLATLDPEIYAADAGYPIEDSTSQAHTMPDDLDIPAASEGTAVVHGELISLSAENSPYIAPALYLGSLLTSENGAYLGTISVDEDPEGLQASNGKFVFTDVPPGNYGLFIWTPVNAFIIKDEKTTEPIILEVTAGQTYDLGTIYVP
jgi:hypothetical protein